MKKSIASAAALVLICVLSISASVFAAPAQPGRVDVNKPVEEQPKPAPTPSYQPKPAAAVKVTIPDVQAFPPEEAEKKLKDAGFAVTVKELYSETVVAGKVIGSEPSAGTSQNKGSAVTMNVSLGSAFISTPTEIELVAMSRDEFLSFLESNGFTVGKIDIVPNKKVKTGNVVSSSLIMGTKIARDKVSEVGSVSVVISGEAFDSVVPDVRGLSFKDAVKKLEAAGFVVGETINVDVPSVRRNSVIAQTILPGMSYFKNSPVSLIVSESVPKKVGATAKAYKDVAIMTIGKDVFSLNSRTTKLGGAPYIENGATMIPAEDMFKIFATIDRTIHEGTVKTFILENRVLQVHVGNSILYENGSKVINMTNASGSPVNAAEKEEVIFLPVRTFTDILNVKADWDAVAKRITFSFNK